MKKLMLAVFCGTLFLTSCKDNAINPDLSPGASTGPSSAKTTIPKAVLTTLSKTYPTAQGIAWNQISPTSFMATFKLNSTASSAKTATIQNTGALLRVGNVIDPATLPAVIITYLNTNYAGYVMVQADAKVNVAGVITGYETLINVGTVQYELNFNAAGVFTSLETANGQNEGMGIGQATLLPAIITYLTTTYPGYVFKEAETKMVGGVLSGYQVEIVQNTIKYEIFFDAVGAFLKVKTEGSGHGDDNNGSNKNIDTPILQSDLPTNVGAYLAEKYASYVYVSSIVEKDALGTIIAFEVKFTSGGVAYEAEFNALGVFIKLNNSGNGDNEGNGNNGNTGADFAILQTDLPVSVGTYMTTNYTGYVYVSSIVEKNAAGVILSYEVRFMLAGVAHEAEFGALGAFVRLNN